MASPPADLLERLVAENQPARFFGLEREIARVSEIVVSGRTDGAGTPRYEVRLAVLGRRAARRGDFELFDAVVRMTDVAGDWIATEPKVRDHSGELVAPSTRTLRALSPERWRHEVRMLLSEFLRLDENASPSYSRAGEAAQYAEEAELLRAWNITAPRSPRGPVATVDPGSPTANRSTVRSRRRRLNESEAGRARQ